MSCLPLPRDEPNHDSLLSNAIHGWISSAAVFAELIAIGGGHGSSRDVRIATNRSGRGSTRVKYIARPSALTPGSVTTWSLSIAARPVSVAGPNGSSTEARVTIQ